MSTTVFRITVTVILVLIGISLLSIDLIFHPPGQLLINCIVFGVMGYLIAVIWEKTP